jgi:hypothetical protein
MLEWGSLTSQPGSLVRDAAKHPVFTGSQVRLADKKKHRSIGAVTELISETLVRVAWGSGEQQSVEAAELVVLRSSR